MPNIRDLLSQIAHRKSELPKGSWKYYQEWNHVLFFHWAVDPDILKPLIPKGVDLDLFEGKAYISLVPFTMQKSGRDFCLLLLRFPIFMKSIFGHMCQKMDFPACIS